MAVNDKEACNVLGLSDERAFAKSDNAISEEAMQALMGTLCRVYSAQVENGSKYTPIAEGQVVSPTGVMVTASGMLRAANLAVFELGMWQSWTGRWAGQPGKNWDQERRHGFDCRPRPTRHG